MCFCWGAFAFMGLRDPNSSPQIRRVSRWILTGCLVPFIPLFLVPALLVCTIVAFVLAMLFISVGVVGWLSPIEKDNVKEKGSDGADRYTGLSH